MAAGCCALLLACGGKEAQSPSGDAAISDTADSTLTGDTASDTGGDGTSDLAIDGPPGSCGTATCSSGQLCYELLYAGVDGDCTVLADGGTCPEGWTPRDTCHGPNPGCVPPRCAPVPPTCGDAPAGCASCACFKSDPCQTAGHCVSVVAGHVKCACNP